MLKIIATISLTVIYIKSILYEAKITQTEKICVKVSQLFSTQKGVSKIESVVGLLQFLQIMLIPDTQDSTQNGFHIPLTDLKCEAKKQRKNEQISNFDFLIMLQIRILSLKSYGGYYRVSYTNLSNNFPCVFEDEFQWSWQLGS
ncbi:Hypothetical_protein [Hexamita inflata]|uniref:Hypothetical_protein n=1 Tax=Hexamita inflata TaxID=28002 RepID=A0AA86U2E1_9EUKA|nr:Hypothetical protein HINF_LOCUS27150 [Hexamita inflata]